MTAADALLGNDPSTEHTGPPRVALQPGELGLTLQVALIVWSVVGWLAAFDLTATAFVNRAPLPGWRGLVPPLAEWYLWVPLTPAVLWVGRRFPIVRGSTWTRFLPHVAGIVLCSGIRGVVYFWTAVHVEGVPLTATPAANLARMILGFMPVAAILYCGILAVDRAIDYARRSRVEALRSAELETQLARAELRALQANLHPHFLFNTLHSVSALVRAQEPTSAVNVIAELSELLRYLLQREAPEEVALAEELAFVQRYLGIEQVRFSDRLRIAWAIDPDTRGAAVPRLLLQPLVENAIRHGVGQSSDAGVISIGATRQGDWLELAVSDDGPGPDGIRTTGNGSSGWGLASTRARLVRAYGSESGVMLRRSAHGGTLATVRLPFHVLPSNGAESQVDD